MALSSAVKRHHTVWVRVGDRDSVPVRYATSEDELICFGDTMLCDLHEGDQAHATVHEIACGPPIESFDVTVRIIQNDDLTLATVAEVHGNAPDRQPDNTNSYEILRRTRRFLGLRPE
jgi:hypothetical protein